MHTTCEPQLQGRNVDNRREERSGEGSPVPCWTSGTNAYCLSLDSGQFAQPEENRGLLESREPLRGTLGRPRFEHEHLRLEQL